MGLLPFDSYLLMWPLVNVFLFLITVYLWHAHSVPGNLWTRALDIFPSCTFIWVCLQDFFLKQMKCITLQFPGKIADKFCLMLALVISVLIDPSI